MNKDCLDFLERNNIDVDFVRSKVDTHIYSREEINRIVAEYDFQGEKYTKQVSIRDIFGYDTEWRDIVPDIFLSMDDLFDSFGTGYQSRSISMLSYDKDTIMEGLRRSFEKEEMVLVESGEGNFLMFTNGLHRFTLLKALYLAEASKVESEEELEALSQKYIIPAVIVSIELEKTYLKYLTLTMESFGADFNLRDIRTHYDDNFKRTGNIEFVYKDGKRKVLSEEEFRTFVISEILKFGPEDLLSLIETDLSKYESLKKFIEDLKKDIDKTKEGGYPEHD